VRVSPPRPHDDSIGDAYCFVAIERNTKLVLNFAMGRRSQATTDAFIEGLRHATSPQRLRISTDGFQPYLSAITTRLGDRCDFAQLIKVYNNADPEGQRQYSPADILHTERVPVIGSPDPAKICTSHVERQNLTIRMSMRRLTRLTNGFSKKWENLWAVYCLHFANYNFCHGSQDAPRHPCDGIQPDPFGKFRNCSRRHQARGGVRIGRARQALPNKLPLSRGTANTLVQR
jgi:IS1 family transposase